MKSKKCECGASFLIPTNTTERQVLFDREKPLELIYADVDVGINRKYLFQRCIDCSALQSLVEIGQVIDNKEGIIAVDWDKYLFLQKRCDTAEYSQFTYLNSVLDKLGVLSGDADGNWVVMSQIKGCLNPMFKRGINLYFTSPDDALAFAKATKAKRCHLLRVEDVIAV